MAFETPNYNYGQATGRLTQDKGIQDVMQNYGRFLGQERFRRGMSDSNREFKNQFPKIGQNFNQRGLYHSGLRKQAQQTEAQDYQRATDRGRFDFAAQQNMFDQTQALRDSGYEEQLLELYAQAQRARAVQNPLESLRGLI